MGYDQFSNEQVMAFLAQTLAQGAVILTTVGQPIDLKSIETTFVDPYSAGDKASRLLEVAARRRLITIH